MLCPKCKQKHGTKTQIDGILYFECIACGYKIPMQKYWHKVMEETEEQKILDDNIEKCSQCHNDCDKEDLIEQNFDDTTLKICQDCLEEIMTGERTIVI
jgi:Zn ribbon nucleic-acid-binding protein